MHQKSKFGLVNLRHSLRHTAQDMSQCMGKDKGEGDLQIKEGKLAR
jgi:hypothetical protein